MLSVKEAQKMILEKVSPGPEVEEALLWARGLYLARDLAAKNSSPPFDTSAMDGFAIKAEDTQSLPAKLKVIGNIPAGSQADFEIHRGESAKIMTGAPLPPGANAVVPVEDTSGFGGDEVEIFREIQVGSAIRKKGENIEAGQIALKAGTRITPEITAILASMGCARVAVRKAPTLAILSTGDELVEIDQPLQFGQIRNSNAYMLSALSAELAFSAKILPICQDTREDTLQRVREGLESDFLLVTGGSSVGERDFVKEVLDELGTTMHFQKVNLKPGKPTVFATLNSRVIFGLPGNPVSSLVAFLLFVQPCLLKFVGSPQPTISWRKGILDHSVKPHQRERFLPVFWKDGDPPQVEILPWKGSGDLFGLARANGFGLLAPGRKFEKGEEIFFLPR